MEGTGWRGTSSSASSSTERASGPVADSGEGNVDAGMTVQRRRRPVLALPLLLVVALGPALVPARAGGQPPPGGLLPKGIVYSSPGGVDLHLNVYTPEEDPNEVRPGVLTIHGGGWSHGGLAAAGAQA